MLKLLRRLLAPRPDYTPAYRALLPTPKLLEARLLEDIAAGRLTFKVRHSRHATHRQEDWVGVQARVTYEVDYPTTAGGTFSYVWVCGSDLSLQPHEGFDTPRVMCAIVSGKDPGAQQARRSLYHVY